MSKADQELISGAILNFLPQGGSSIGNIKLLGMLRETWTELNDEKDYQLWDALIASDLLATGRAYRQKAAYLHHPGRHQPAHSPVPSRDTARL